MVAEGDELGAIIRRMRLARGLSQQQLAERSGLSVRAVSDLERGQRSRPRPETVRMLADALQLAPDDRQNLLAAAMPELQKPQPPRVASSTVGHRPPETATDSAPSDAGANLRAPDGWWAAGKLRAENGKDYVNCTG